MTLEDARTKFFESLDGVEGELIEAQLRATGATVHRITGWSVNLRGWLRLSKDLAWLEAYSADGLEGVTENVRLSRFWVTQLAAGVPYVDIEQRVRKLFGSRT